MHGGRGRAGSPPRSCDPRLLGSYRMASTPRTGLDLRMRAWRLQRLLPTTPTSQRWASIPMTGEGWNPSSPHHRAPCAPFCHQTPQPTPL